MRKAEHQHTPGPWEAHIGDDYVSIDVAGGDSQICEFRAFAMEDDSVEPDARLMAAAPELLDVVIWLRDRNDLFVKKSGTAGTYLAPQARAMVDAAIAKAVGTPGD